MHQCRKNLFKINKNCKTFIFHFVVIFAVHSYKFLLENINQENINKEGIDKEIIDEENINKENNNKKIAKKQIKVFNLKRNFLY